MLALTEEARKRYEEYLRRVRACMSAAGQASPDEVMADIEEHVSRELEGTAEPVSGETVRQVLARLGEPEQWIAADELPWWRRTLLRVRTGPEDWRLAYATLGVLFLGVLFGYFFGTTVTSGGPYSPAMYQVDNEIIQVPQKNLFPQPPQERHEFNVEVMVIFWVVSFILARAAIAAAVDRDAMSAGQKWLVYPSVVVPYVIVAVAILIAVPCLTAAGGFALSEESLRERHACLPGNVEYDLLPKSFEIDHYEVRAGHYGGYIGAITAGLWWITLGTLLLFRGPQRVARFMFAPFCKTIPKKACLVTIVIGMLMLALAAMERITSTHTYF
jgi:hypothetical protein